LADDLRQMCINPMNSDALRKTRWINAIWDGIAILVAASEFVEPIQQVDAIDCVETDRLLRRACAGCGGRGF
jgi:hypothetical protein